MSTPTVAVPHDLADLCAELQARADLFDPARLILEPHNRASSEGFARYAFSTDDPHTGERSPQELITQAMRDAREVGLGGHPPAHFYHQQLLELPPDPRRWRENEWRIQRTLLARSRHLFLLAMQQELSATPLTTKDPDKIESANRQVLAVAARTMAQGALVDSNGREFVLPEATRFRAEDFAELAWPRFYLAEDWVMCQRHAADLGFVWSSDGQATYLEHVHDTYWWPVVSAAELGTLPAVPADDQVLNRYTPAQ